MNRVLIVDDQPSFRRQLSKLLTFAGFEVVGEAGDIPEALKMARDFRPDIAVVDVMLPGENGLAGTLRLKSLIKPLRIFLVSSHQDSADLFERSAREIGAEDFISKDELNLDVVKKWMEKVQR
jgi:DNA-binding NarL/FixJ family response regulator